MNRHFAWLAPDERKLFLRLNTPAKLQDYLNALPQNFEESGESCMSPKRVLSSHRAHCFEGALFAAAVLWFHGKRPLVMHVTTKPYDEDHVVAIFKDSGRYGAISKTNHAVLRYRDAVYLSPRELALSYFNEYFMTETGKKTMVGYTEPIDLGKKFGQGWLTEERNLWQLNDALFRARHLPIAPSTLMKKLRPADRIERNIMYIPEQRSRKRK